MNRPEAIIFDLGKVLVDFDYSIVGRRVAARGRLNSAEVQHLIDHSPLLFRYETGAMSREEFYRAVCAATGYEGTLDEFALAFADIFTPIARMVELHAELRRRRVPAFIFSNTNDLAVDHIRGNFPFFSDFDGYVLSYEQRAMKPDERIYQAVETMTGRHEDRLLYLDDRPENIAAGAVRGWQTLLHQDAQKTWAHFRALGLV